MRRMAGADAGMLYQERPHQHLHTAKVAVLDPPPGTSPDDLATAVKERAVRVAPLRWVPVRPPAKLHHFYWRTVDPDPDHHVRRATVEEPGGRQELAALVSDIVSTPLPRARPLWEITVVDGLDAGRVALVLKLHHAVADGGSSARIITQLMDGEGRPDTTPADPAPDPRELGRTAVADLRDTLAATPDLVRRTREALRAGRARNQSDAPQPPQPFAAPATIYNEPLTPRRAFAYTVLPFDDLRAMKEAFACTLNDVLLALCSSTIRAHLESQGRLPDDPITTSVPVGVRRDDELDSYGNRVGNMYTSLATDVADPLERLRAIQAATDAAKEKFAVRDQRLEFEWQELWPLWSLFGGVLPRVGRRATGRPSWNVICSNVRGPATPLSFAGAPMVELHSMGPLIFDLGLNFTGWSYGAQFSVGVATCADHVPDVWALADGLQTAFDELTP